MKSLHFSLIAINALLSLGKEKVEVGSLQLSLPSADICDFLLSKSAFSPLFNVPSSEMRGC